MRAAIIMAIVAFTAIGGQATAQQTRRVPSPKALDPANVARGMDQLADMIAKGVFQQADVNRDGMLTRTEAINAGAQYGLPIGSDPRAWAALDLNRDGVVVQREFADALRSVQARTSKGLKPF
jgi:hypothetical protein